MDTLALNILRIFILLEAVGCSMIARIVTNPDWKMNLDQRAIAGYMLFDKPEMLPEEMLDSAILFIKAMVIAVPVILIWSKIVKPWIMGG